MDTTTLGDDEDLYLAAIRKKTIEREKKQNGCDHSDMDITENAGSPYQDYVTHEWVVKVEKIGVCRDCGKKKLLGTETVSYEG